MRVLVIGLNYAPEPTGIAPYTTALAEGLAERGYDVRVLTAMPHYPEWSIYRGYGGWKRTAWQAGVRVTRLRHYIPKHPNGVPRLIAEVSFGARVITTPWHSPDLVLVISPALFASAIAMARRALFARETPVCVWVQDIYSAGMVETRGRSAKSPLVRIIAAVESAVLRHSNGVVVIHDRFAEVARNLGAREGELAVVRNWTHVCPAENIDRPAVRARLGWGEQETVVLHSGAMGKKQDLGNVIEAARFADLHAHPIRFVLAGDGSERAALEHAAEGVMSVQFVPPLPEQEYAEALVAADVLLVNEHAGLREMAVPSKLTSYFASGRPVVAATEASSLTASEVAASGAGVRVDPGDPEALVAAVLGLRADPQRAADLGRLGGIYRDTVLSARAAIDHYDQQLKDMGDTSPRTGDHIDRYPAKV